MFPGIDENFFEKFNSGLFGAYFKPVDDHHPHDKERLVYPKFKRFLTKDDLGKSLVRIYPFCDDDFYDWNYIPGQKSHTVKLRALGGEQVTLEDSTLYKDDGYWLPYELWPFLQAVFLIEKARDAWIAYVENTYLERQDYSFKGAPLSGSLDFERHLIDKKIAADRSLAVLYIQSGLKEKAWFLKNQVLCSYDPSAPSKNDALQKNIRMNLDFFRGTLVDSQRVQKCLRQVFEKWTVALPESASYQKNTNDFGIEITELLLSKDSWGRVLAKTFQDLSNIAKRLGIEVKRTLSEVPIRDHLFRLHTGEVKKQFENEHLDKAYNRAVSKGLYFSEKSFARSSCEVFNASLDTDQSKHKQINTLENHFADYGAKEPLCFHAEGGNMLTLTTPEGVIKVLLGRDQFFSTLSAYRLSKSFDNEPLPEKNLTTKEILETAEEMYAQGLLLQDGKSGLLEANQISTILNEMLESENYAISFRQRAISKGFIRPFEPNAEKYRPAVEKYLGQKQLLLQWMAKDLGVNVEDLIFVPELIYHLDTFIKSGPHHSILLPNFLLCSDILQKLLDEAASLKLTAKDTSLIKRYLQTAKKREAEVGEIVAEIEKVLSKSGFPVIPTPLLWLCDEEVDTPSQHINFTNALSGWSAKTNNYYYITTGAVVGDNLGNIFNEIFKQFLERYKRDIEVCFIGGDEGMRQWNHNLPGMFSGIHCFTFESQTNSH